MLASGSWDGTVSVWDAASGEQLSEWSGHVGPVHAVAIDERTGALLSCGEDGTVRRWATLGSTVPPFALLTSPGPLYALCVRSGLAHVAGAEGAIYAIEIDAARLMPVIRSHNAADNPTSVSLDHRFLLGRRGAGELQIWETDAPAETVAVVGRDVPLLGDPAGYSVVAFRGLRVAFRAWPKKINGLALSEDGTHLYSCGDDGGVRAWDLSSGGGSRWFARDAGVLRALCLGGSPELVWTAGDDGSIRAYRDGVPLGAVEVSSQPLLAVTASASAVLAAGQDTHIHPVDNTPELLSAGHRDPWRGHFWHVTSLDPHPTAPLLASASKDYTIRIWSTETGREVTPRIDAPDDYIDAVAWFEGPEGPSVLAGSEDGSIRKWSSDGRSTTLATMGGQVQALSIARGGTVGIAADDHGAVIGIDVLGGHTWEIAGSTNSAAGFLSIAVVEAEGATMALGVRRGGQVCWLGTSSIEVLGEVTGGPIVSASVSADLTKVAVGDREGTVATFRVVDGTLRLADVDRLHSNDWVTALAWSSDGAALVSGGWDRVAWLRRDGQPPTPLRGHGDTIRACGFDRSGAICITGSWDGQLCIWGTDEASLRAWAPIEGRPVSISVLTAGSDRLVAIGNADTTVTVLELGGV